MALTAQTTHIFSLPSSSITMTIMVIYLEEDLVMAQQQSVKPMMVTAICCQLAVQVAGGAINTTP
ncbi:hypothetical protein DD593_31530 [Enterobacter cloacae complex sp. 742-ADZ3-9B]|nr:hypothetical protein DD593_31530 [Enterobacter cloacae complex sp. 742-ADZ3-9B]